LSPTIGNMEHLKIIFNDRTVQSALTIVVY
jgi:hypothetical protein